MTEHPESSPWATTGFAPEVDLRRFPSIGASKGPCLGYVIDHINPLACGGADRPENMHWQTKDDAKAKDKWVCKGC